jgi:hypothetical protein
MVKLSRTSYGFLAFSSLTSLCFAVGAKAAFGSTFAGVLTAALGATVGVVLTTGLTAALGVAFLATGLIATLTTGLIGAATFLAVVLTTLLATALTAAGDGTGADGAGAVLLTLG